MCTSMVYTCMLVREHVVAALLLNRRLTWPVRQIRASDLFAAP